MSAAEMAQFNQAHHGYSMVVSSGTSTHFMQGENLCQLMEQLYSPAFHIQRQKPLACEGNTVGR